MSKIVLMMALAGIVSLAGSKDRDWQNGKVLDFESNPYFSPSDETVRSNANTMFGTQYQVNNATAGTESVSDKYVIETEDSVYLVSRVRLKLSNPANIKKYTRVKFAIEKNKLWVVDGDGKQLQTKIVEQKKKPS